MEGMIDPVDGGLLFCHSKSNTNGKLLSEDTTQQWINSETQRRKKKGKKKDTNSDDADNDVTEEERRIQELEAGKNG